MARDNFASFCNTVYIMNHIQYIYDPWAVVNGRHGHPIWRSIYCVYQSKAWPSKQGYLYLSLEDISFQRDLFISGSHGHPTGHLLYLSMKGMAIQRGIYFESPIHILYLQNTLPAPLLSSIYIFRSSYLQLYPFV